MREPDFYDLDKYRLDEEWESQPKLYRRHAMELADAKADSERAEAVKAVVYAEVEQEFRSANSGAAKAPTEAAVKAAVITDKRYRDAVESAIQAQHAADVAKVAVDTLNHRKMALENLVSLFLSAYYAKPRARRDEEDAVKMQGRKRLRNKLSD